MNVVTIRINETPARLHEGAGFKGYLTDQSVIAAEDVFSRAAQGTHWHPDELAHAFDIIMRSAYEGIQADGRARMLGKWFKMMATVQGPFESPKDTFKEPRNSFALKFLPLKALKRFKRLFKVKTIPPPKS